MTFADFRHRVGFYVRPATDGERGKWRRAYVVAVEANGVERVVEIHPHKRTAAARALMFHRAVYFRTTAF